MRYGNRTTISVILLTSGEVIRAAMITHGVSTAVVEWICHMLGNRNLTTNPGNTTMYMYLNEIL